MTNNYIGRSAYASDAYANALFDDLRIWNVARTPDQIRQFMTQPVAPEDPNLVLNYRFDESSGTTVVDSRSTSPQNGTLANGAARLASTPASATLSDLLPGTVYHFRSVAQNTNGTTVGNTERFATLTPIGGTAVQFDGTDDFVRIAGFGNRMPTTEVTVEFWQRVHSLKNQSTFALDPDNTGNRFQAHVPYGDGTVYWDFQNTGGGRLQYTPPVSIVGTWQHFALVSSVSNSYMRIYRNGNLEAWRTGAGTFTRGQYDLILGKSPYGNFDGELDDFRVWNVARTESQIRDNLIGRLAGNESGLVAYYRMDEGAGGTLLDATINGSHGLLVNGPLRVPSTAPFGMDPPTIANNTVYFQGTQSNGIAWLATAQIATLIVTNLTSDITPPAGIPGVDMTGPSGLALTVKYAGGLRDLITSGLNAPGIRARTVGDNGARGGDGWYNWPWDEHVDGYGGGNGVNGATVTLTSAGDITTSGTNSPGIYAQSQGGQGGTGGQGVTAVYDNGKGGAGGVGGDGGVVALKVDGSIRTDGSNSPAVYARSVGGRGGDGGQSSNGGDNAGTAGVGGRGGNLSVAVSGTITNSGGSSHGVLAHSEGGRGGDGGEAHTQGDGGHGGRGGDGGTIAATSSSAITILGKNAHGLYALSQGGDGGEGNSGGFSSGTGGYGGAGGNGGAVTVTNSGPITTAGSNSRGVYAVSLAGRGGNGSEQNRGGDGGHGSNVVVNTSGSVATAGGNAHGVFALSQAGDGGNGAPGAGISGAGAPGGKGGNGGAVAVTGGSVISTLGTNAHGVFALSQGRNGGDGGGGVTIGQGGSGGPGGLGGTVAANGSWIITTHGDNSHGISANSVGGRGGNSADGGWIAGGAGTGGDSGHGGAVGVNFAPAAGGLGGLIDTFGDDAHGIFAQSVGGFAGSGAAGGSVFYSSGGSGGSAGNGGNVTVTNRGVVTTRGEGSHAIFAESVGGGGGSGGSAAGLFGGGGGDSAAGGGGGVVNVLNSGQARTEGTNSRGIFAQSVGGSGGNAGLTVGLFAAIGGSGGLGGKGGNVGVTNSGQIATAGSDSSAIFAQSVGGGGGTGGGSGSVGAWGSVAVGGSGGGGGTGAVVNVFSSAQGSITTEGDRSHGIFAQSVGGGGGNGGYAVAGSVGLGGSAAVAVGGTGGAGGHGSNVVVSSGSAISTEGKDAHGIFAQSVGGGGGAGGFSMALSASDGAAVSLSVGGKGEHGGNGDGVNVASTGEIHTSGERSYGILAQSVGGGGGNGGFSVAGAFGGSAGLALSFGGSGAGGGLGGAVAVDSASKITTEAKDAHGIFAQSVGGGGGSGGSSISVSGGGSFAGAFSLGGSGGGGASAKQVSVTTTGQITTSGEHAYGILAQSVGGGGGDGGFSVAGAMSGGPSVPLSFGGSGAGGGLGGNVAVTSQSQIATFGKDAHGIFAQSVGGGGGSGGFSVSGGISGGASVGASFGGSGGGGASAGNVTVHTTNSINTAGNHSYGILAQSVGGGGGDGGFSVAGGINGAASANFSLGGSGGPGGVAGAVAIDTASSITTTGTNAHGIFAQSVGGGGGSGGFSVAGGLSLKGTLSASMGGKGGGGASASNVIVASKGTINTSGDRAYGILAQSVGGGGGDGGFSFAGAVAKGPALTFSLGGAGSTGGVGRAVSVLNAGNITTRGGVAHGVFAQSVGGGGGSGGMSGNFAFDANAMLTNSKSIDVGFGLGGKGGGGGAADAVGVTNTGSISTLGGGSHGVMAQSVGGGGGSGGSSFSLMSPVGTNSSQSVKVKAAIGGDGGVGGSASNVVVFNQGLIDTAGKNSYGILAQSIGGGGGDGGDAEVKTLSTDLLPKATLDLGPYGSGPQPDGPTNSKAKSWSFDVSIGAGAEGGSAGAGGKVGVTNVGSILTRSDRSHGIFAQSVGGGGGAGGASGTDVGSGSGSGDTAVTLNVGVGGKGGVGGSADAVVVSNQGTLTTEGDASHGVVAQSIGGGGGVGGASVSTAGAAGSDGLSVNLTAAIGGGGGIAGHGSNVVVVSGGRIETAGEGSFGILAQSIGGGGGDGGNAEVKTGSQPGTNSPAGPLSDGATNAESKSLSVDLTIGAGGLGAAGGHGGTVRVTNLGEIITRSNRSHAIYAQSVGGGGGTGGASATDTGGGEGDLAITATLSLGGKGGGGGSAAAVTVDNQNKITTLGDASHGIVAQSVGGGGGTGGASISTPGAGGSGSNNTVNLNATIGGSGEVAGNGNNVHVVTTGRIETSGQGSYGILAQSVGGGGGDGGNAEIKASRQPGTNSPAGPLSDGDTNAPSSSWSLTVGLGLGGQGGAGGAGGKVGVTNIGEIVTHKEQSHGIFAQSVGGGGGAGGASATDVGSGSGDISISLSFGIGGKGGAGGSADAVAVSNQGTLTTEGDASHGVVAQSIGGGGGVGGASVSTAGAAGSDGLSVNLTAAIGGGGGIAGHGSNVVVVTSGRIETAGEGSFGILAQSIGGGGGDGGNAEVKTGSQPGTNSPAGPLSDGATNAESKSLSVDLTIGAGGLGAAGGHGGTVRVTNLGEVITRSNRSHAIYAQSVGGGGGTGGASATDAGGGEGDLAITATLSLGGKGGGGGSAATVTVDNQNKITTLGDASHGIVAQSVGGGGGTGGASISTPGAGGSGSNNTINLNATIGGSGANGGSGGSVLVVNGGRVATAGQGSYGIMAQSVGGGGGDGGNAEVKAGSQPGTNSLAGPLSDGDTNAPSKSWSVDLEVGLGGLAGAGGNGGSVVVTNTGSITTSNAQSHAIFAQSVGGGGGAGGASATEMGSGSGDTSITLTLGLGGKGGKGGSGDTVLVNNRNSVTTLDAASHGIAAQSIGGGGGMGGATVMTSSGNSNTTVNLTATIGGRGGVGGNGSNVVVLSDGRIDTSGQGSYGLLAQSIGGGGGNGGASQAPDSTSTNWSLNFALGGQGGAAGKGGTVTVTNVGAITTQSNDSHGALVQSIGGGGGNAGSAHSGEAQSWKDLNITVGAQGGTGNDGGAVSMANSGSITTHGDGSMGVLAQSIGGGGGVGSTAGIGRSGRVGIGGGGGAAGDGDTVVVSQAGAIDTYGVGAQGIFAQSVGGGGGIAGNVDRGLTNLDNVGIGVAFRQDGGSAGDGGAVVVASAGNLTTRGASANGIFAQSVGGGGGLAGSVGPGITYGFAGSVGGVGSGGDINVAHSGNITTLGDAAHGIFAQSAGGSNGLGGKVEVSLSGDVIAQGAGSAAIFAQSTGLRGGTNILVNIASGTVQGGSGSGVGVRIADGANNTLINHGTISSRSGAAIIGTGGNETINNYGTVIGSVNLGAGRNAFNNYLGATLSLGGMFNLGAGNVLTNRGLVRGSGQVIGDVVNLGMLSPGSSAGSLTIGGNLTLLPEASLTFDLGGWQQGSSYDFVRVTNFVQFAGTLSLSLTSNFRPTAADTFTLMEFGSGSGLFGNVLNGGRLLTLDNLASFQVSYNANSLQVSGFQSPDSDGDGMNDYDESLAGTDWLDSRSVLRITSLTCNASGQRVIRFPRVAGKNYTIEFTHDLRGGTWRELWCPAFTFPDTNTCQWIDDGTETGGLNGHNCFYRVKVQLAWPAEVGLKASIRRNASGHMTLQFSGVSGNRYVVEYTTNLTSGAWRTVPSPGFTFPAAAVGQWVDDGTQTGGLGGNARFYRVKLLWSNTGNTPPRTWISRNASGRPVLLFAGLPSNGHVVEYTANLQSGTWTALASAVYTFPAPGLCQWIDDGTLTGGSAGEARFYRVRQQSD